MSDPGLEVATKLTGARFLEKYTSMIDDIEQLRSDVGSDRWGDSSTNDPAVWFEWVQAFWEVLGATFRAPVAPGPNTFETREGKVATLNVPYDGSDPTVIPRLDMAGPGAERASLEEFRVALASWSGTLGALGVRLSAPSS